MMGYVNTFVFYMDIELKLCFYVEIITMKCKHVEMCVK